MDPVTSPTAPAIFSAQTAAPINPDSLTTSTAADGTPALSVAPTSSLSNPKLGNALDDTSAGATTGAAKPSYGLDSKTPASTGSTPGKTTAHDSSPTVTGLRQRVNSIGAQIDQATDHPAVKNAKGQALKQVDQVRDVLGRSPLIVDLEKRTGVDRVVLVAGGVVAYIVLIPLNLFNLGFFFTQLLTFVPPLLLSARVLEKPDEQKTKLLLSYYVVFGFVQFAESAFGRFLANHIPQYFTVKLAFLAYLIHPRTKGAFKIHESVLRPLLTSTRNATKPTSTPPVSRPSASTQASPTMGSGLQTQGQSQGGIPSGTAIGSQLEGASSGGVHLPSGGGTHGVGLDI